MMTPARGHARTTLAIVGLSMLAGAAYTLATGEDANWDWQNYHEYNVWAVLTGRYAIDVAPAGFQTYFNPLVYFPVYWLRHLLPPPLGLTIIGAVHGLNLALIVWLTRVLLGRSTVIATVSAVAIAATGPMTLSETGTSFTDVLLSLLVIAGFGLILVDTSHLPAGDVEVPSDPSPTSLTARSAASTRTPQSRQRLHLLLAGLLIGAAVGLKLTNVVFALGAVVAVLLAAHPITGLVWLGVGGALGAGVTHGAWSVMLWRELGNPIFPLFNGVFRSPELLPTNILDLQFYPRGLLDALAYPFYWLAGINRSSEYPFRDARFAAVMLLIPIAIVARLWRGTALFTRRDVQFFAMVGVSYAGWLGLFAIHRYAVALELLCAPLIVLLIARLWPQTLRRGAAIATALLAAAIAAWTQPGDWGRRPWSDPYRPAIPAALAQPATYLLLSKPVAYVAPLLPPASRFYQLADIALPILPGGIFDRRIRAGLADPLPGGIWSVANRHTAIRPNLLQRYALAVDTGRPCVSIEGVAPGTAIHLCPLKASDR